MSSSLAQGGIGTTRRERRRDRAVQRGYVRAVPKDTRRHNWSSSSSACDSRATPQNRGVNCSPTTLVLEQVISDISPDDLDLLHLRFFNLVFGGFEEDATADGTDRTISAFRGISMEADLSEEEIDEIIEVFLNKVVDDEQVHDFHEDQVENRVSAVASSEEVVSSLDGGALSSAAAGVVLHGNEGGFDEQVHEFNEDLVEYRLSAVASSEEAGSSLDDSALSSAAAGVFLHGKEDGLQSQVKWADVCSSEGTDQMTDNEDELDDGGYPASRWRLLENGFWVKSMVDESLDVAGVREAGSGDGGSDVADDVVENFAMHDNVVLALAEDSAFRQDGSGPDVSDVTDVVVENVSLHDNEPLHAALAEDSAIGQDGSKADGSDVTDDLVENFSLHDKEYTMVKDVGALLDSAVSVESAVKDLHGLHEDDTLHEDGNKALAEDSVQGFTYCMVDKGTWVECITFDTLRALVTATLSRTYRVCTWSDAHRQWQEAARDMSRTYIEFNRAIYEILDRPWHETDAELPNFGITNPLPQFRTILQTHRNMSLELRKKLSVKEREVDSHKKVNTALQEENENLRTVNGKLMQELASLKRNEYFQKLHMSLNAAGFQKAWLEIAELRLAQSKTEQSEKAEAAHDSTVPEHDAQKPGKIQDKTRRGRKKKKNEEGKGRKKENLMTPMGCAGTPPSASPYETGGCTESRSCAPLDPDQLNLEQTLSHIASYIDSDAVEPSEVEEGGSIFTCERVIGSVQCLQRLALGFAMKND